MPKNNIDYSNTTIYKIYCKNSDITDVYVGHTTNFIKRKYQHKICSNNIKKTLKIYDTIRQNGGWENWDMIEIAKYNCKDSTEARIKENVHFEELKANLNSYPPFSNKKDFYCKLCNIQCNSKIHYDKHILTKLHKIKVEIGIIPTIPNENETTNFYCKFCDFKCFTPLDI